MCKPPGHPVRNFALLPGILAGGLILFSWTATGPAAEAVKPLNRSISASRQFIIYSPESKNRLRLSSQVDDTATLWRETLGLPKEWKTPVILNFPDAPGRSREARRTTSWSMCSPGNRMRIRTPRWAALRSVFTVSESGTK